MPWGGSILAKSVWCLGGFLVSNFLIHSSVGIHFGYFNFLAIVNSTTINMGEWLFFPHINLISFGCVPSSGIAG
jgi:hypothetical protein